MEKRIKEASVDASTKLLRVLLNREIEANTEKQSTIRLLEAQRIELLGELNHSLHSEKALKSEVAEAKVVSGDGGRMSRDLLAKEYHRTTTLKAELDEARGEIQQLTETCEDWREHWEFVQKLKADVDELCSPDWRGEVGLR
jgi:hypothetical protein